MKRYYGQVVYRQYTTITLDVPDNATEGDIKLMMCEQAQFKPEDGEMEVYDFTEMEVAS